MDDIIKRLDEMNEEVDQCKSGSARAEGILSEMRKTLKEKHGLKTTKSAQKMIKDLDSKKEKLGKELDEKMERLEDSYDWD